MTCRDNKETILKYYEAANAGDVDAMLALVTDDYTARASGEIQVRSKAEYAGGYGYWLNAFPDGNFIIEDIIGEGDLVAVRLRMELPWVGEFMGKTPDKPTTLTVTSNCIYRFEGDRIGEVFGEDDRLGMYRQMGLVSG